MQRTSNSIAFGGEEITHAQDVIAMDEPIQIARTAHG
jgi:hypothetical protein